MRRRAEGPAVEVLLFDRQRAVALPVDKLRAVSVRAASQCLAYPGASVSVLETLAAVEISVVSDRVIAQLHRRFLDVRGATDVITFPHGEIVVSAATAARQARQNDESTGREVARYIVHGFLHLHGHEDTEPQEAAAMWRAQEEVLKKIWPNDRRNTFS